MKIRNGFVSNSSSSSFIINGKIDKVAKSMLKTVIEDFGDWGGEKATKKEVDKHNQWKKNLEEALKIVDIHAGKIGITMPSCNYETYILQVGDQVHVQTANNHSWDLDYTKAGHGADDGEDDIVYKTISASNFFNVRNKLIHSKEMYADFSEKIECPNCAKGGGYGFGPHVKCEDDRTLCAWCFEEVKIIKKK